MKWSDDLFRSIWEWRLHLKWPDPSVLLQVLSQTSSDPWRLLQNSVSSAWEMCQPCKMPVPAQTYLHYLSSCRERHQNIKAHRPHPFYFWNQTWQQPADHGLMIDGEMSLVGGKKEGKETIISHKNYFMFNIWLVSSQLLMWRSISKDWCALKLSIFVSEWNKWRICHHMDQPWLDTKPIKHMWGKRASICRWPFSSLLTCAYTSVVFKGNRNEG